MTPSAVMDICRLFAAPSLWLCPNTVFPLRKPVPAIPYPAVAHRPLRTDFLAPPLAQGCFGVSQNCRRFFRTQSVSHSWLQILTCPLPPVNAMVRPFLPGTHKGGHSAWEVLSHVGPWSGVLPPDRWGSRISPASVKISSVCF